MHVLILALLLLWFVWPIGVAFVGLLLLLFVAKKNKKRWRKLARRCGRDRSVADTTTNASFEEYRADVLRRLDAERAQFSEFLERLRKSRDKEAFDRFLSDRRSRPA